MASPKSDARRQIEFLRTTETLKNPSLMKQPKSILGAALNVVSWIILLGGFSYTAQIAASTVRLGEFTTDAICSLAGAFVVLLTGSLLHSTARDQQQSMTESNS
jgi:hypothetical protein